MFELLRNRILFAAVAVSMLCGGLLAQDPQAQPRKAAQVSQDPSQNADPLKRPVDEKRKKEQSKALKQELSKTYRKWLDEDVRWIITDEERSAFKQLSNDEERDAFIENFWLRRDPSPDTVENEFKEDHYRRIAYANEHFAAGIPGWKTDRGRIYIMYGPADQVESHPSGGAYERPIEEGGGSTSTYPFEDWRYRYIEGIGQEVIIEFVDTCMCGEYHMSIDRSEKDALLMVPGAGLTMYEQMGLANKTDRFTGSGMERLGTGPFSQDQQTKQFDRLEQYAKLNAPPPVKFKDLENELVTHKIRTNMLPFDVRLDFVRVTGDTVLVPIALQMQNKDVTWNEKDGVQRMNVNILGRLTTLTGRIAQTFEDTVTDTVPDDLLQKVATNWHVYAKALPLRPGRYRLDIVLKDVNGDRVGVYSRGIVVPEFSDDKLANSSLIVADQMYKVPSKSVGSGDFVIGDTKVRPRVSPASGAPAAFKQSQKANFWMQVYNLGINDQTKKPNATIEYDVVSAATNKSVLHKQETTEQMGNVGDQLTLEKSISLNSLPPGIYSIRIKVTDNVSQQTITPEAKFAVEQ
jgi:GWxTD domain-containing protein